MLQLEDIVGVVKRFLNEPEAHGPDARQHTLILSQGVETGDGGRV